MHKSITKYTPYSTLTGVRDAVLSLTFSAHGAFVAATGYDGVRVWDLSLSTSTPILVNIPHQTYDPQNAKFVFTASIWLYFERTDSHVLVLGTLRGDILFWKYSSTKEKNVQSFVNLQRIPSNDGEPGQVLSFNVEQREVASGYRGRIAAATMDQCVTVWSLSASDIVTKIFCCKVQDFIPKAVQFHMESQDVLLFARSGGGIQLLDAKTGQVKSKDFRGPPILGSVALSSTNDTFVSWTGESFQLFRLIGLEVLQTFSTGRPTVYFPRNIVFGEQDRIVVGGTDHGCGYVFQVGDPSKTQILEYPKGGLVQHVATTSLADRHFVAIAGSSRHQAADIIIFQKFNNKDPFIFSPQLEWLHFSFSLPRKFVELMVVLVTLNLMWIIVSGMGLIPQDVLFPIREHLPKTLWSFSPSLPSFAEPAHTCDPTFTSRPTEASRSDITVPDQDNSIRIFRPA